jgi:hypothetical protein
MSCLNISNQEFSTPFQIAAHLEIPGLPRVTHPALAANTAGKPTTLEGNQKVQYPANKPAKPADFHIFPKLSEFDLWMAALSM